MPCHIPATSVSSRRPRPSLSRKPPAIAARLNLSKPGERAAHDLVHRFSTGRWPLWRVLDMKREGQTLFVAVEWRRGGKAGRYALAEVALNRVAVRWRDVPDPAAARAALAKAGKKPARRTPR